MHRTKKHRISVNRLLSCVRKHSAQRPQKPLRLIKDGEMGGGGGGVWRWGKVIYLSLHRHRQNDSCIKNDSDESHFNVSLIVRDKVTRQCPQTTTFEEKGELKRIRTEVSLLTTRPNRLTCLVY